MSRKTWNAQIDFNLKSVSSECKYVIPSDGKAGRGRESLNIADRLRAIRFHRQCAGRYAATKAAGILALASRRGGSTAQGESRVNTVVRAQLHTPMVKRRLAKQRPEANREGAPRATPEGASALAIEGDGGHRERRACSSPGRRRLRHGTEMGSPPPPGRRRNERVRCDEPSHLQGATLHPRRLQQARPLAVPSRCVRWRPIRPRAVPARSRDELFFRADELLQRGEPIARSNGCPSSLAAGRSPGELGRPSASAHSRQVKAPRPCSEPSHREGLRFPRRTEHRPRVVARKEREREGGARSTLRLDRRWSIPQIDGNIRSPRADARGPESSPRRKRTL